MLLSVFSPNSQAADLQQLEDAIVGLTAIEQSALIEKLESRLGVNAAVQSPKERRVVAALQLLSSPAATYSSKSTAHSQAAALCNLGLTRIWHCD